MTVRRENITCPADNFYSARIVNFTMLALISEAFGKFRNTPKRWRMDETRVRLESIYFEFLSIRRETGVKQSKDRWARLTGSSMNLW